MNFTWREKRKYFFILAIAVAIFSYSFYKLYPTIFPAPTCLDNIQNQNERGVDCGGVCALVCKIDILPLEVKFAKAIKTEKDLYDIVALVTNKNKDKNIMEGKVDYTFNIYDKTGSVIQVINSSTTIPLGQDFPIIIQNISLPLASTDNGIDKVSLSIDAGKPWYGANSSFASVFFKTLYTKFKNGKSDGIDPSRLSVQIQNLTSSYFRNFPVAVLMYDEGGNLIAVNETLADTIDGDQIKTLGYTWRNTFTKEPAKIDVYPIITPYTVFK